MVHIFGRVYFHVFLLVARVVEVEAYHLLNPGLEVGEDLSTVHVLVSRETNLV